MVSANSLLKQRITMLRWALPLALALIAVIYQLGLSRWIHNRYNDVTHFAVEVMFFSTTGPVLAYLTLKQIERWLGEKAEAETLARISERRLAAITASSADAILSLDGDGRITSWNQGAGIIFEYRKGEIAGRTLADIIGGGEAAQVEQAWLIKTVQDAGYLRGYETTCQRRDGSMIDVEITATRISADIGTSEGLSVILRDITDRKRREAEIKQLNESLHWQVSERTAQLARKVEELGRANADLQNIDQMRADFVSLVSHQVRAPLTNMSGAVQRMQAACGQINPTCSRMFSILDQQTARLDRLVQDVLNLARLEAGELALEAEPVSLFPVVEQVVEQTRARVVDRAFSLPAKPGFPLVCADRDRVAEVLANLLDNAVKYSPPDGKVEVDLRAAETEVTISIRDHGAGLPPGDLERVFEKFYRTDGSDSQLAYGYGLGLYFCRRLVEAQLGRIWAENHPEGGAVFSFTLPVWQDRHV